MNTFTLRIQDSRQVNEIAGVVSFIGEDASGSFGIMAGHARMLTTLVIGLARFRTDEMEWRYLALPGGVLYFKNDQLTLSTRRFVVDDDYTRISAALQEELLAEEEKLHTMKASLHHMEEELLRRLWDIGRPGAG